MKSVMSAAVVLSALAVSGATYRTNNVEGLVHLLKTYSGGGHTVELEAGDYCCHALTLFFFSHQRPP